jgi:hypothetical protein
MLGESQKRAADLAVSHYGVSPACVQRLVQAVLESQARGKTLDLLEALTQDNLITPAQAREMRQVLERTLVEPGVFGGNGSRKGKPLDIYSAPTLPPEGSFSDNHLANAEGVSLEIRRLGDYRILRLLGEGGMGSVFLAYQESQKRHVAIKVLAVKHATNQAAKDRFYREAKSGALLHHPNIVRNFAVGQDKPTGLHYLVMEYVDGPGVDALLEKHGKLTVGDAVHVVLDIARGLEHAHSRNIVHRDIKPANMLITKSGLAKLADLGLAKRTDEPSHLTGANQGFGTPYYMPYEQAMNAKTADARSDLYALGATFYHLLAGDLPFPGTSAVEIVENKSIGKYIPASVLNPDVPRLLDTILARLMAREPRHRYQTASELIVDLERSQLAAPVPSFIDPGCALRDPIVRQRLTAAMQATAMELRSSGDTPAETHPWFVRYKDKQGQWRKVKMSVSQIIRRFQEGKFSAEIEVSPHANGDFRPILAFSEFQDLASDLMRTKTPEESSEKPFDEEFVPTAKKPWLMMSLLTGMALVLMVLGVVVFLSRS